MARKAKGCRGGRTGTKRPDREETGGERHRPRPAWRWPIPLAVFSLVVLIAGVIVWSATSSDDESKDQSVASLTIAELPTGPFARALLPPIEDAAPRHDQTAKTTPGRAASLAPLADPPGPAQAVREGARAALAPLPEPEPAPARQPDTAEATVTRADTLPLRETAPTEPDETATAALPPTLERTLPAPSRDGLTLAPAPDPALLTEGRNGALPVIAPDGRRAWQVYARPFDEPDGRPRIAILLANLGLSQSATKAAIQQLPGSVTLGFVPYARGLEAWMNEARAAGHEVFLELPMEPFDYPESDPGPHTLLTTLDDRDNIDRLDWLLSRTAGYVGVTNFMGDKFTSSPESIGPVLEALRDRGLMFLDARTSRESVAGDIATKIKLPRALNNRFLDIEASRVAIDARLLELEEIARTVGYAVGIGFPYPVTLERIASWSATLDAKGITLAPMSALANLQTE